MNATIEGNTIFLSGSSGAFELEGFVEDNPNAPENINANDVRYKLELYGDGRNNKIWVDGNSGYTKKIYAGEGDDTIYGGNSKDIFYYEQGEGNDVIYNYEAGKDSIFLKSGNIKSSIIRGSDVILNIEGGGSITLKQAKGKEVTIETNETSVRSIYANDTKGKRVVLSGISFFSLDSTISPESIDATSNYNDLTVYGDDRNNAIWVDGGQHRTNNVYAGKGNDIIYGGKGKDIFHYYQDDGNDVIYNYESGRDVLFLKSGSIMGTSLKNSDVILNIQGGGSITLKQAKGKEILVKTNEKTVRNIYDNDTKGNRIVLSDVSYFSLDSSIEPENIDAMKISGSLTLYGDERDNAIWIDGSQHSTKEIYAGRGNDTIYGGNSKDVFCYEQGDGKDTVYNFESSKDKIRLRSGAVLGATVTGDDVVLQVSGGSITLKNMRGKDFTVIDANDTSKTHNYLATAVALPSGVSINSTSTTLTVKSPFKGVLNASDFPNTVKKIDASKDTKYVSIIGNNNNNTILAGKKGGEIYGLKGNDILYGNSGKDVFWYGTGDGKDTIQKFQSGKDVLSIYDGDISSYTSSGNDVVLKVGSAGQVKLVGMAKKKINLIDSERNEINLWVGKAGTENKLTGTATESMLVGGSKKDVLTAGKGNATLFGGKGNDVLKGGSGKDVFLYSSGADTIQNYTSGKDKICLSGTSINKYSVKGSDVILTTSTGSMTVKNAKGKKITIVDSKGRSNTYTFTSGTNRAFSANLAVTSTSKQLASARLVSTSTARYITPNDAKIASVLVPKSDISMVETSTTSMVTSLLTSNPTSQKNTLLLSLSAQRNR